MRRGPHRLFGLLGAGLATAVVASGTPAAAADERDAKVEVDNVTVLGQTLGTLGQQSGNGDVVLSVHGVRRVPKGTVLYWSIGYPKELERDPSSGGAGVWPNWFYTDRYGSKGEPKGTVLVDQKGRKAYEPLVSAKDGPCICSKRNVSATRGDVSVLYAVMPELPADVTTVDVRLGFGSVVQDVPVEDGVLEPAAPADDRTVLLGQKWPEIDLEAVASSYQPEKAIFPLTTTQATKDDTVTTQEEPGEVTLNLAADVLFAVDKADLTPKASAVIDQAAKQLNEKAKGGVVTVTGYTDSDGSNSYNQKLSERRAQSVANALRKKLTVPVQLKVSGRGETNPVASNKSEKGKALNRRVTVTFVPKGA